MCPLLSDTPLAHGVWEAADAYALEPGLCVTASTDTEYFYFFLLLLIPFKSYTSLQQERQMFATESV